MRYQGEISASSMKRIANAVEFVGGVGKDFSKHAKGLS